MNADGTGCAKQPDIADHDPSGNGLLEHDFDPAFSPPGPDGTERIVFASTRGNLDSSAFDYTGPQRTPEDPTKPNANLYVLEPDPNNAGQNHVRQLTWQLNMERLPNFMQDGRLVFTAEKREPNFYELALRRQNLDGGDYHPLYSQRGSIGYTQATYVTELSHKDFAVIFSNQNAVHGAGALGVFNRSIGIDFTSTNSSDYPVIAAVINPTRRRRRADFFLHSLDRGRQRRVVHEPVDAARRADARQLRHGRPLHVRRRLRRLRDGPRERDEDEARRQRGYRGDRGRRRLPPHPEGDLRLHGGRAERTHVHPAGGANADITVLDMTVLASLLFQNTPTGRVVEPDLPQLRRLRGPAAGRHQHARLPQQREPLLRQLRQRLRAAAPGRLRADQLRRLGSLRASPADCPMVLHLADDSESQQMSLPRWQREEMTFLPGEYCAPELVAGRSSTTCAPGATQSISGQPIDAALNPDFLTQASNVVAVTQSPVDLTGPPSQRGPVTGPPANP